MEVQILMESKLNGWNNVFEFTLLQTLKGKSFLLSTIILAILCFVSVPFLAKSNGSSNFAESMLSIDIDKTYYYDGLGIFGDSLQEELIKVSGQGELEDNYKEMEFECLNDTINAGDVSTGIDKDMIKEAFGKFDDCDDSALIIIGMSDEGYEVEGVRTQNSNVGSMDMGMFEEEICSMTKDSLYKLVGITQEQIDMIMTQNEIVSTVIVDGQVEEEKNNSDTFMASSMVGMCIFMFMVIILAVGGEAASTSMITEKASRAIEYVLTSIKPLALIFGKVLACIVTQIIQVAIFIGSFAASYKIFTQGSTKITTASQLAQAMGIQNLSVSFSTIGIILALLIVAGGIVLYITLACLIGSTASRMEELAHTNMIYSAILIVGAYTAMILTMPDIGLSDAVEKFLLIFPLSSPFVTPAYVAVGDCSVSVALASLAAMLVAVVLLLVLVAKVFEAVILYNGSRVKFVQILEFAGIKKAASHAGKEKNRLRQSDNGKGKKQSTDSDIYGNVKNKDGGESDE